MAKAFTSEDPLSINFLPDITSTASTDSHGEPSVLDYARFHGLCRNYLSEPSTLLEALLSLPYDSNTDTGDPSGLPTLEALLEGFTLREKLTVTKDGVAYLQSVLTHPECLENAIHPPPTYGCGRRLKVEIPLLRSDPAWDLVEFKKRSQSGDLRDIIPPLEAVNEENGEGIEFS